MGSTRRKKNIVIENARYRTITTLQSHCIFRDTIYVLRQQYSIEAGKDKKGRIKTSMPTSTQKMCARRNNVLATASLDEYSVLIQLELLV